MSFHSEPLGNTTLTGLYFLSNHCTIYLPLTSVFANIIINDISARVTLVQEYYHNDASFPSLSAKYSFPIPARASVAAFVMIKEDGTKVVGNVKEKKEAKDVFENAVEEGKLTSLMEEDHADVFTVSVGNILHGEKVKIELSYITELSEDENHDSIRFTLPTHISTRYGSPPTSITFPPPPITSTTPFLNLTASIELTSPNSKIYSPSHFIQTELGPSPSLPNYQSLAFPNYARVSFTSPTSLNSDFILSITSSTLDSPKCLAEIHPSPTHNSLALALTLVPRFKVPEVEKQEFVFLVDRSGSMSGARMETAKKALVVLLRSLPSRDTRFNIYSFGSRFQSIWDGSKSYNQATLDEATRHVDSMTANFGGTELFSALEHVCKTRSTGRPTSLFVLTDGATWDLDSSLSVIQTAVSKSPQGSPLRVFTLGIGNSASTALVEGLARVGNGCSSFVNDLESFTGKVARLLKAAKSPVISNVRVGWGVDGAMGVETTVGGQEIGEDFEMVSTTEVANDSAVKINLFDMDYDEPLVSTSTAKLSSPSIVLAPPEPIQQSPSQIKNLSPANRLYVYAILSSPSWKKGDPIPKSVFLRGSLDSGAEVELEIPVTTSHLTNDEHFPPPIHTLAAKKLVQDLLDGNHSINPTLDFDTIQSTVEASVVRLGTTYSLATKYTSFVCVDDTDSTPRPTMREPEPVLGYTIECRRSFPRSSSSKLSQAGENIVYRSSGGASKLKRKARQAGEPYSIGRHDDPLVEGRKHDGFPPVFQNRERSLASTRRELLWEGNPRSISGRDEAYEEMTTMSEGSRSRSSIDFRNDMGAIRSRGAVTTTESDKLDAIVRDQLFDGSFLPKILQTCQVNSTIDQLALALPVNFQQTLAKDVLEQVVATLVAMVCLEKLKMDKDAWIEIYEKAQRFCKVQFRKAGLRDVKIKQLKGLLAKNLA